MNYKIYPYAFHLFFSLLLVLALINGIDTQANSRQSQASSVQTHESSTYRYIGKGPKYLNEPLKITEVLIGGKPIQLNSKIPGDDNWLKGLSVKVKNISDRVIKGISLKISFPSITTDPQSGSPISVIEYGTATLLPPTDKPVIELPLMPGEEAQLILTDVQFESLKQNMEGYYGPSALNSILLDFASVIFDDDISWTRGSFLRRDPDKPKRWILID